MSRNRVDSLTNKRGLGVARPNEGWGCNVKRPRKAEPQSPFGAGNEIRTHDFNLGNIRLALNTIPEIQQHQPRRVPWGCVPSRGVPCKVEGWVEGRWSHRTPFFVSEEVGMRTRAAQLGS